MRSQVAMMVGFALVFLASVLLGPGRNPGSISLNIALLSLMGIVLFARWRRLGGPWV